MFQLIVILICFFAFAVELYFVFWGWVILGVPFVFLLLTLVSVKQKKWKHIPELSDSANRMLQKYGHYYTMPFAGRDFSACASTLMFAGIVAAIIGVFKGFWWGIGIAIVNYLIMGLVSRAFDPTNFLADPLEQKGHEEIIQYISEMKKPKEPNS